MLFSAHAIQHHTAEATHLLHTDEDDGWTQVILKQGDKNYDLRVPRSKPSKQQPFRNDILYMKVNVGNQITVFLAKLCYPFQLYIFTRPCN